MSHVWAINSDACRRCHASGLQIRNGYPDSCFLYRLARFIRPPLADRSYAGVTL